MRSLVLVLMLLASQVHAQAVYKCVDEKGRTAYMSQPCDGSSRVVKTYDAVPDSEDDERRAAAELRRRHDQAAQLSEIAGTNTRAMGGGWSPGAVPDARRAKCDAAKAHRESMLRAVGLGRTYELLQDLDEQVREACKGL